MSDFDGIKEELLNMRSEIINSLATGQKNNREDHLKMVGDEGDHASQERYQELSRLFSKRDQRKLNSIEEALRKINQNEYGICEECGEPIEIKRLRAVPFAKMCFDCQSNMEINYSSDTEDDDYTDLGSEDSSGM